MTFMEMLISLGGILLFLMMSIMFLQGKGAILIAGYNTMSEEEKSKFDEVALCKATGKVMVGITCSMVIVLLGEFFQVDWLMIVGFGLMSLFAIGGVVYMYTGNRFEVSDRKNKETKESGH